MLEVDSQQVLLSPTIERLFYVAVCGDPKPPQDSRLPLLFSSPHLMLIQSLPGHRHDNNPLYSFNSSSEASCSAQILLSADSPSCVLVPETSPDR